MTTVAPPALYVVQRQPARQPQDQSLALKEALPPSLSLVLTKHHFPGLGYLVLGLAPGRVCSNEDLLSRWAPL